MRVLCFPPFQFLVFRRTIMEKNTAKKKTYTSNNKHQMFPTLGKTSPDISQQVSPTRFDRKRRCSTRTSCSSFFAGIGPDLPRPGHISHAKLGSGWTGSWGFCGCFSLNVSFKSTLSLLGKDSCLVNDVGVFDTFNVSLRDLQFLYVLTNRSSFSTLWGIGCVGPLHLSKSGRFSWKTFTNSGFWPQRSSSCQFLSICSRIIWCVLSSSSSTRNSGDVAVKHGES